MRPTISHFGILASLVFGLAAAHAEDAPRVVSPYSQITYPAPTKKPVVEMLEPIFEDLPPVNDRKSVPAKPVEKAIQAANSPYAGLGCDTCGSCGDACKKSHLRGWFHRSAKGHDCGCDPCR
jgi:hypothetical protein